MALIEEEPSHPRHALLVRGVPALLAAFAISVAAHEAAHRLAGGTGCGVATGTDIATALGSLAGPVVTFGLALASFAIMLRRPNSLFFAAMAFVNVTLRLPETLSVFFRLLLNNAAQGTIDEGSSLALLRLHDMTIPTVIMCFYSIMSVFFAVIVVHDVRRVPYKWIAAVILFLLLGFLEQGLLSLAAPLLS